MQEYDLAVVGIFWGAAIAFALSAIFERNEHPWCPLWPATEHSP